VRFDVPAVLVNRRRFDPPLRKPYVGDKSAPTRITIRIARIAARRRIIICGVKKELVSRGQEPKSKTGDSLFISPCAVLYV